MTTLNEAKQDFYITNYNKEYDRVSLVRYFCIIIDTLDYGFSVAHYVESVKDFKRDRIKRAVLKNNL